MVQNIYIDLQARRAQTPGPIALILAICPSFGSWELDGEFVSSKPGIASQVSTLLMKQALYALENVRVSSRISIEAVQASILLTFHIALAEGKSPHTRLLHSSALTMARELGLHRIDVSSPEVPSHAEHSNIQAEVGKKVWWHLASTDW